MTRKYETRCWLCSSTDLEPDARGMHCKSCGATFNVLPKPGEDCITITEDKSIGRPSASPSGHLINRIAKVRDNAIH